MHCLYSALHTQSGPPTDDQVKLAQGSIPVDAAAAKEYLGKVEMATSSIIKGLEQQARKAQPFDEVEKPEFICLMEYMHHGSTLKSRIPGHKAIRSRIMKMGEDSI
ncbi:hypothetical protein B0H10DRAFT_1944951 [Mycena sp. CBHHK59/15]|nr:hypothetical protein B0H10DRAFT_1944951 [Mycena sp. CBHHK59/15]